MKERNINNQQMDNRNVINNQIHDTPLSSMHWLFSTHDKKSMVIKVFCLLLGLFSLFKGQWIGIILVMCISLADFILSWAKTDSFGFLLKMLLLLQGLAIWYIAVHSVSKLNFLDTGNHFISNKYDVDAPIESSSSTGGGGGSDFSPLGAAASAYPPVTHNANINQHSTQRIEHEHEHMIGHEHEQMVPEKQQQQQQQHGGSNHQALRGKAAIVEPFSLEGLAPAPPISESWTLSARGKYERNEIDPRSKQAHQSLCNAAVLLDLPAVKYLLYDYKVPADSVVESDARRNAFHCLSSLYLHADASPTSLVFSLLKGTQSWATKLYDPPLDPKSDSIVSSDVLTALESQMEKVAQYLQRAGVPATLRDAGGNTPLHYAAYGGSLSIMRVLIESGADVNAVNNDHRAPAHFALAQGQAAAGSLLFYAKANMDLKDKNRVTPRDLIVNPGPIYPADAIKYFEMEQRPAKQIERVLHPELHPEKTNAGWAAGTGNWSTQRLKGYEEDMECKVVDQYWAHEITADDIFYKYLSRNAPVLIRGLIDKWGVIDEYKQQTLVDRHGYLKVAVSDIPYSQKFGGDGSVDMTLDAYIATVKKHTIVGGSHPWYVFKGHRIPEASDEDKDSLVPIENCKTPQIIQAAFGDEGDLGDRTIFVNAQWALGGEGTVRGIYVKNCPLIVLYCCC